MINSALTVPIVTRLSCDCPQNNLFNFKGFSQKGIVGTIIRVYLKYKRAHARTRKKLKHGIIVPIVPFSNNSLKSFIKSYRTIVFLLSCTVLNVPYQKGTYHEPA